MSADTDRLAALLLYLRGLSDDLADALLTGQRMDDISDADWDAASEEYARLITAGVTLAPTPPDPLREALLDSLRVRTSDYNYRPLSDRERDLLATQPAPDPLPPLTCPPDCPRSHEADGSHYDVRNDPDLTLATALLDAVEEAINTGALPGNIHHRLKTAYNAVVKEANRA